MNKARDVTGLGARKVNKIMRYSDIHLRYLISHCRLSVKEYQVCLGLLADCRKEGRSLWVIWLSLRLLVHTFRLECSFIFCFLKSISFTNQTIYLIIL